MSKIFKIPGEKIKKLVNPIGACFATDRISVDGFPVGYMYRELTTDERFSGWTFLAGDESQDYLDQSENTAIYDVNTVANYDADIIPCLEIEPPCAFEKIKGTHGYKRVENPPVD